ncbi:RNA polymerase sigma-70 factor [Flavobacterium aquidurense]|uniref:RNA polymerase sigma-70 factor n=1 Tax=Flavobacterium aquidurense TaxID=362413 RepID=UPI00371BA8F2
MNSNDLNILNKLHAGDNSGYKELFDLYYEALCSHSLKFCDSFDMAEDIVQDLFVTFWKDKLYLKIDSAIGSYLFNAVKNNALQEMRKKSKFVFEELDQKINQLLEDENFDVSSLEEERHNLMLAIEKLSPQSREVFTAIVLNNMKYKDVAESLGISVNTVKTQYSRALKKLRGSSLLIAILMLK